jgi:cobalt transporter subunit CbtB
MASRTLTSTETAISGRKSSAAVSAAAGAVLGILALWVVGFSHVSAFHNAAHDVRHSNAFPCH